MPLCKLEQCSETVAARLPTRHRHWRRVGSRAAEHAGNGRICSVFSFSAGGNTQRHLQTKQRTQAVDFRLFLRSVQRSLFPLVPISFFLPMVDLVAAVVCESWSCGGEGWFRRLVVKASVLPRRCCSTATGRGNRRGRQPLLMAKETLLLRERDAGLCPAWGWARAVEVTVELAWPLVWGRCCCRRLDREEGSGKMVMQTARWESEGELLWLLSGVWLEGLRVCLWFLCQGKGGWNRLVGKRKEKESSGLRSKIETGGGCLEKKKMVICGGRRKIRELQGRRLRVKDKKELGLGFFL